MLTEVEPKKCELCTPGYAVPGKRLCQPCLDMLQRCATAYYNIQQDEKEATSATA